MGCSMKSLYIDRDRLTRGQPCIAVRHENGDVSYEEEIFGFGFYRMRAPQGEPLTPKGPAAWVETYNLLTIRNIALASSAISVLVILAIVRWVS